MSEPSARDYVQPDEVITYVDAAGHVTEDKSKAVGGEIVHRLPNGSLESVLFSLTADEPPVR
jgi:hypothetical protein